MFYNEYKKELIMISNILKCTAQSLKFLLLSMFHRSLERAVHVGFCCFVFSSVVLRYSKLSTKAWGQCGGNKMDGSIFLLGFRST